MKTIFCCSLIVLGAAFAVPMLAQYDGNTAAKAAFEQGEKARESGRFSAAIVDYQKAIALDPDYADAYQSYIFARQLELSEPVIKLYEAGKKPTPAQVKQWTKQSKKLNHQMNKEFTSLAKKHPNKGIYLWALGQLYNESNPLRQEEYCQQAVHLEPNFAPGYQCLATTADLRGDEKSASEYMRKVTDLEPHNVDARYLYIHFLESNPEEYKAATMQFVEQFRDSPKAALALYWYAQSQQTDDERIVLFEQLRKQFPPTKFDWSDQGMEDLFAIYDRTDPAKAQSLVHEMLTADPKAKDWVDRATYADAMVKAQQQINEKDSAAALATLQSIKSPGHLFDMRRKELLQARALDLSGKTSQAYADLLASYTKHPTDEIGKAVYKYGAKTGKSQQEISAAVWSAMQSNSTPSIPFTLQKFSDDTKVTLSDYKGHVVIVDFWYPNCGPCRQSFPFLQRLGKKYKDKGVVILAINGQEGQAAFVSPFLKSKGYDFIALMGNATWANKVYHVQGYPTTFLIGANGRVYFKPHVYNTLEERAAQMEIEELLAHEADGSLS